ncbi:hypothetical protein BCEP4_390003 [Burkholderia cepacia]|nr:hypothetical protein BCEP4_390003 [Burkholderia cepacia]
MQSSRLALHEYIPIRNKFSASPKRITNNLLHRLKLAVTRRDLGRVQTQRMLGAQVIYRVSLPFSMGTCRRIVLTFPTRSV